MPKTGKSVLHIAAYKAPMAMRALLADGADPNVRDKAGRTPLHAAAKARQFASMTALLELPDMAFDLDSKDGTALSLLLANKDAQADVFDSIAAALVRRGASLDAVDKQSNLSCTELLRLKKKEGAGTWAQTLAAVAQRGKRL